MTAVPDHVAAGYVAAAYAVAFVLLAAYVAIMVVRHVRLRRERARVEALAAEHGLDAEEPASERELARS